MSTQGYSYTPSPESTSHLEGLTVELIHPGGERRVLPVEAIASTYLSVRWGMSGFYDLNLKVGTLTARSLQAQRKGRCLWVAADLPGVRDMVSRYFDRDRIRRQEEIQRHAQSMPRGRLLP